MNSDSRGQPLAFAPTPIWTALHKRGAGEKSPCECTAECGDDPRLPGGTAVPCKRLAEARALRVKAAIGRALVTALVDLLDRMLPEVPEEERATDAEWDELRAQAGEYLASGLTAGSNKANTPTHAAEVIR